MAVIPMKALLESGVHFGHRTHKWDPRMKPYIFTERNNIHIIDLQKTVKALEEAYKTIVDTVSAGGTVLFVGTKRQAQETIQTEAMRCGMPYVTARWLGGMLTNWRTIRGRINEMERIERMREKGDFAKITKKEGLLLTRELERLEMLLGGVRQLARLPDVVFIVDVFRESTAVHEANLLDIPIVAMVDTNCNPTNIDYVIPSNDDAIRAIKLIVAKIADAVMEGKAMRKDEEEFAPAAEVRGKAAVTEEPELTDEDLLGEATLRKLVKPELVEEVVLIEAEKEAEAAEVVEAEAAEVVEAEDDDDDDDEDDDADDDDDDDDDDSEEESELDGDDEDDKDEE